MAEPTFDATYYERNYRSYVRQNPGRKLRCYARAIERHLSPRTPRRIHDLGCGFARFLGSLDPSWEVYGSDVSEYAIAAAAREYPRGHFKVAGAADRGVFPGTFGVVTAFDVLEHVADLDAVAATVLDQLAPDGRFVFVVPVYDGLSGPIIRLLDHDQTHVHKWPRRRWLDWARSHFEILDWTGLVRYLVSSVYYIHMATRLLRSHTPAILVVCSIRS